MLRNSDLCFKFFKRDIIKMFPPPPGPPTAKLARRGTVYNRK